MRAHESVWWCGARRNVPGAITSAYLVANRRLASEDGSFGFET
jgi:hypothetical protein